ncbi:hypothetical protein TNCV_1938371 [Trichonephila clavipes]|nr:hypothetical protein TNCV_1938371 [Trichonephila clavipes]
MAALDDISCVGNVFPFEKVGRCRWYDTQVPILSLKVSPKLNKAQSTLLATQNVCYASFSVRSYHSTSFAAEWNVRKASIASFTLDFEPKAFTPPMVQ